MKAEELIIKSKNIKEPNEIFTIYEDYNKLSDSEKSRLINLGIGDSISMRYITAIEMKRKGTWDSYIEEWKKREAKTGEDNLIRYMKERNLTFPGKKR